MANGNSELSVRVQRTHRSAIFADGMYDDVKSLGRETFLAAGNSRLVSLPASLSEYINLFIREEFTK